jgi:hypothetical protein
MAKHDWIMWADIDDTAEGLEHLREILAKIPDGTDVLRCPYIVSEQGVTANYRERVWRNNGQHEWVNPLHENLVRIDREERPQAQTDRVRIVHAPRLDRDCSQDRNLRILEAVDEEERTHSHMFYLLCEYARRKDARAVELAQRFLAHPKSATPERYETYMTLAAMTEDPAAKAAIHVQAFAEDPSRSEALYELTSLSLICDQPERALNFAGHMMTCKWPDAPSWNHRRMFYGFARADLYLQAMRAAGRSSSPTLGAAMTSCGAVCRSSACYTPPVAAQRWHSRPACNGSAWLTTRIVSSTYSPPTKTTRRQARSITARRSIFPATAAQWPRGTPQRGNAGEKS